MAGPNMLDFHSVCGIRMMLEKGHGLWHFPEGSRRLYRDELRRHAWLHGMQSMQRFNGRDILDRMPEGIDLCTTYTCGAFFLNVLNR